MVSIYIHNKADMRYKVAGIYKSGNHRHFCATFSQLPALCAIFKEQKLKDNF